MQLINLLFIKQTNKVRKASKNVNNVLIKVHQSSSLVNKKDLIMNKDMIYKLLSDRDLNVVMIAEALGVTKQSVHQVINSGRGSKRIAEAVAKACDLTLFDVFPFYAHKKTEKQEREERQKMLNKKLAKLA